MAEYTYTNSAKSDPCQQFSPERRQARKAKSGRVLRKLCHSYFPNPRLFPIRQDSPHKWAVGTTFEWEFDFPVHPNPAYNRPPEPKRKKKQPAEPAAAPVPAPKVSKPATTTEKPQASQKPKRVRLTPEERQERARARTVEARSSHEKAILLSPETGRIMCTTYESAVGWCLH